MHIAYNRVANIPSWCMHVSAYMGIGNMHFSPSEDDTMTVSSIQSVRQVTNIFTMFWNPMLLTPYLLPFYTAAALLQCASANVAQSAQDLILTTSNNSPITSSRNG